MNNKEFLENIKKYKKGDIIIFDEAPYKGLGKSEYSLKLAILVEKIIKRNKRIGGLEWVEIDIRK